MSVDPARAKSLFLAASDLPAADRPAYLERECGGDAELRDRVEALLRADAGPPVSVDATGAFDPSPATGDFAPEGVTGTFGGAPLLRERPPATTSGAVIAGRYTLVEVIGEGGMGSVYLASQTEPVKRQVAVKLIRTGMDSKAVLARFDAERQALALMDHPNIARIYDGGVTPAGQPFFVMELVSGVPLTDYCDSGRLTVDARLQLFVSVCQAVQHAHQKGIIHRDLKPGNVLVTEVDGRPTPKVIDFGVAKATEVPLTGQSLADTGAIVGTPAYMSPEQADPTSSDIDTRTDVYALGVILYELLTGSPPVDARQFKRGAILEMLRMVREVEPPRPSTRLRTADALPGIATNRSIEPAKLAKLLRGELDWVVMKALEKDRTRRYDTANGLARDIQRYLADEVVEARPPSRGYRLKKFVKRNKGQVIAATAVFLALVAGMIGTAWQAVRAEQARADEVTQREKAEKSASDEVAQRAKAEKSASDAIAAEATSRDVLKFLEEKVFAAARPEGREGGLGREVTLRQALDAAEPAIAPTFADRPLVELQIRSVLAQTYEHLSEWEKSDDQWRKWLAVCDRKLDRQHPDYHTAVENLLSAGVLEGKAESHKLVEEAYRHFLIADPYNNRLHLQLLYAGIIRSEPGREAEARQLEKEAQDGLCRGLPPDHPFQFQRERSSANAMLRAGRTAEALSLMESNLGRVREKFPPGSEELVKALADTGELYSYLDRHADAARVLEEGFRLFLARSGPNHAAVDGWLRQLSAALGAAGRHAESAKLLEEYLPVFRKRLGPDHHDMVALVINLAATYNHLKRYAEIPPLVKEVLSDKVRKEDFAAFVLLKVSLSEAYFCLDRPDEAVAQIEEILEAAWQREGDHLLVWGSHAEAMCARLRSAGRDRNRVQLVEGILRRARELAAKKPFDGAADVVCGVEFLMADTYVEVGEFDLARKVAEKTLKDMTLRLGADHPDTIVGEVHLIRIYAATGETVKAATLFAEVRKRLPDDSPQLAVGRMYFGQGLFRGKAFPEAEPLLRESLAAYEKVAPDAWTTFYVQSMLGGALLGQKQYADAEPLLRGGYEGMKAREKAIPPLVRYHIPDALDRLIELYTATNKPDEVTKWRTERAKYPVPKEVAPPPREKS